MELLRSETLKDSGRFGLQPPRGKRLTLDWGAARKTGAQRGPGLACEIVGFRTQSRCRLPWVNWRTGEEFSAPPNLLKFQRIRQSHG